MEHEFNMMVSLGTKEASVGVTFEIVSGFPDEAAKVSDVRIWDDEKLTNMPLSWLPLESDRLRVSDRCYELAQDLNEIAYNDRIQGIADNALEQEREG